MATGNIYLERDESLHIPNFKIVYADSSPVNLSMVHKYPEAR
ncbi:hypothetical protein [Pontixanthobacter rizhaonensis]|nr:hypothetical protein [Pontixanthobacter rizhaonensis]